MMVTFGIGCCRIKFVNTSSAGGQLEHPSDVNNSTSTATGWSTAVDIVRPARGSAPVPQDNTKPAAIDASIRARMTPSDRRYKVLGSIVTKDHIRAFQDG